MEKSPNLTNHCFVCSKEIDKENKQYNSKIHLPVCRQCKGTEAEKQAEKKALDSLGDGFICGCI
ncbi:MAG: hypothetical protein R6U46_01275 [Marinilabilia sp.]